MVDKYQPTDNAPIHIKCVLFKYVVSSAAEVETGALFHNTKMAIFIVKMLETLRHKQEKVNIKTDNTTAEVFSNSTHKENVQKLGTLDGGGYKIKQRVINS